MKNLLRLGTLAVLVLAFVAAGPAQATRDHKDDEDAGNRPVNEYKVDEPHTEIGFKVRHLGIANVSGVFEQHETSIELDPGDLSTLKASTVIEATSVNTGNQKRDDDLRSDNFFDVAKYPKIRFVSTEITDVSEDGTFKLHGELTIRDVTRPIVLDAEFRGPLSAMGKERIAFSASGRIDRFDYGLTWNKVIETGGLIVGETVHLIIEVEAARELAIDASN